MNRLNITYFLLIGLCLAVSLVLYSLPAAAEEDMEQPSECCFTHDGYQGVCHVTPGEGETCDSILEYLNTTGTIGKSYCGGNKLRGGWQLVDCATAESEISESTSLNASDLPKN